MLIACRVGVALILALTPFAAIADDRPFNDVVWCSDGFDQKATIRTTREGLELRIGATVEMLEVDGGTTPYGGMIATSLKTKKDLIVLPGELDASGNWRRIEFCDSLTGIGVEEKDRCRGRAAFGMSRTG